MTPGPRQTIDRACHPTLGEGRLVHGNGPCFFLPDVGEPLHLRAMAGWGGADDGTYQDARSMTGDIIRFDTTQRQSGERHRRRWSPIFGAGWLVDEAWPVWRPGMSAQDEARYRAACGWCRFEPDDGSAPLRWQWQVMKVGRLNGREPRQPKPGKPKPPSLVEWDRWTVVGGYEFRDEPPEEKPTTESTAAPPKGQMALPM